MVQQGDLICVKNSILHEEKWLYIDDYETFGENGRIFGVVQKTNITDDDGESMIEVLIGNEVISMPIYFVDVVSQ